jgi:hypothetical protein
MDTRKGKTAAELEILALEIIRRMQGCSGFSSVKVVLDEHHGWIIDSWDDGTAQPSDAMRAVGVTQIDLQANYKLSDHH